MGSFTRRVPGTGTSFRRATPSSASTPTTSTAAPSTGSSLTSTFSHASHQPLPGTRPAPSAPSLRLLPSGMGSLDDLLGGGLPVGDTMLLLSPDPHTAWGRLVARHFASQACVSGQRLVVLSPSPDGFGDEGEGRRFVKGMPWLDPGSEAMKAASGTASANGNGSESEGEGLEDDGRTRIAWRYERMKRFQTTVGTSSLASNTTIPVDMHAHLEQTGQIVYADINTDLATSSSLSQDVVSQALRTLASALDSDREHRVTRVAVPDLGSSEWGELSAVDIKRFMMGLRALVRGKKASAVVTLPAKISEQPPAPRYGYAGGSSSFTLSAARSDEVSTQWISSLAHLADAVLTLKGFGSDPASAALFAPAHGLLTLHAYPSTHHILAPTLRHSALLGIGSGGGASGGLGGGGAGENNLGFRLKRKRFVVETVHLGIEGGTGERRTEPVERPSLPALPTAPSEGELATGLAGASASGSFGVEMPSSVDTAPKSSTSAMGDKDTRKASKPRARVRFGGDDDDEPAPQPKPRVRFGVEEVLATATSATGPSSIDVDSASHRHGSHGHEHKHKHDVPRVAIRHDRPDLYEF